MGGLPRPEIPPGSQRDLVDALHDLHHRAGWPSLRVLARKAGCSHTTVSTVFSTPRLPTWGVLEVLVEALDGDVAEFRRLWLAASSPEASETPAELLIAGRKPELAAVRSHLEQGTGLLLVTGEAGMGKTRLVSTATTLVAGSTFVASGSCLPLSSQVPLLPVADVLRAAYELDDGQWLKDALTGCAPYVAGSLLRLLPELALVLDAPATPDDEWARQRLFGAVEATMDALVSLRPFAVLLEDLHWADAATLDLVEHLLARGVRAPLVGSWRLDDPATAAHNAEWCARVRRLPTCATLELHPLSREETAEQVALLVAGSTDSDLVERIHRRSQGQPLFTEQLAAQPDGAPMPELLADLLDRRLADVGGPAWATARALGVADRPLDEALLERATGLEATELTAALHELMDQRLLRAGNHRPLELRHPLLAEAIRRRLLVGELADEHRRLAQALALGPDPSPAEIAEHWQMAGDPGAELTWRVAAARAAAERFAVAQAADEWRRALALWPDGLEAAGNPPMPKQDVYIAAMDSLCFLDVTAGWEVAEAALRDLPDRTDPTAAETYRQAGFIRLWLGDAEGALALIDRAVAIHRDRPPSTGYVSALQSRDQVLDALGRMDEAGESAALARELAPGLSTPATYRHLLIRQAIHELDLDHADRSLALLEQAAGMDVEQPDPGGDIHLAITLTDLLRTMGRPVEEIVEAGQRGLDSAARWGLETRLLLITRANMAAALRLAGQVERAAALIDPLTSDAPPTSETGSMHFERVCLDAVRGRCTEAMDRFALVRDFPDGLISNRVESAQYFGEALLWCGRPGDAYELVVEVLHQALPTDASWGAAAPLVVAARASADLAEGLGDDSRVARADQLRRLRSRAHRDPFADRPGNAAGAAEAAGWAAELGRLTRTAKVEHWTGAARSWDDIGRPHDAAYCRWRGAQVALASGQGTLAARLLRRAAADARENVPLTAAIAETAGLTRSAPHPSG